MAEHETPVDAFRRLHASLTQAASHAQHMTAHCADVKQAICRNVASAVSLRCRRLRQPRSRDAVALASMNPPQAEKESVNDDVLKRVQPDGGAADSTTKPGKVSGSLWGPRGARSAASDPADAATKQDAP